MTNKVKKDVINIQKGILMDVYFAVNTNYETREETLDNKNYLVVPVTMMVEGVHSGSHGPILHYAEELGRYPESWDGIPVTIGHPKVNGVYVSANSPDVLTDWAVGRVFNTYLDEESKALKAEAWLCLEDLARISEDTLTKINDNEIIEVSVGVFSDEEDVTGIYNNEQYIAIARNHRPNHLALLPDAVGACSIEDGCGIRVNKKGGTNVTKEKITLVTNENQELILRELNRKGYSVNVMGQFALAEQIREAVYGLDGSNKSYYVEEFFDDYVVYVEHDYSINPRSHRLFQRSFQVNAAGQVELIGEAVQVKKEISYVVVSPINTNGDHTKVERNIQKNKSMCTECVKNLVNGLIANKATAYSEDHREQLEALPEDLLEIMSQNVKKEPAVNTQKKPERADIISVLSENPLTKEEYLKTVAPEVREQLETSMQVHEAQKTKLVEAITANSQAWTEEELKSKNLVELQKIYSLVPQKETEEVVEYLGIGGFTANSTSQNGEVMLPPGVTLEK